MRKTNRALWALLAVGVVGLNAAADDAKTDLEALQGTWELSAFERDGKEVKLEDVTKVTFTVDKFVVKRGDEVVAAGTFKLDPSKKPKVCDTTYTDGPDKGKTFKGIYQIDGDTEKFCRAGLPSGERPTEFKTKPDSGQVLSVYKRLQKPKQMPKK
jgi:uncharacterized protein (TIGR03067 family)